MNNTLTTITLNTTDAINTANAITAVNTTNIGYSVEGEVQALYIVFEGLTINQEATIFEALSLNNIKYCLD